MTRSGLAAALLVGLFAGVYALLVQTVGGQRWDDVSLGVGGAYVDLWPGRLASAGRAALPVVLGLYGLGLLVLAVRRSRRRRCLTAIALVVGALVAGEIVKALLPRPDLGGYGYPDGSLPSVHAIASTGVLLGLLLVLPDRLRPAGAAAVVVLGGPLAYASVLTQAHLCSDVLCGVLLVGAAAALAGPVAGRAVVPPAGRWLGVLVPVAVAAAAFLGRSGSMTAIGWSQLCLVVAVLALVLAVLGTLSPRPAPTPR